MSVILEIKDIPPDLLEYFEPIASSRNDVWTVATQGFGGEHYAVYPPALIEPMILAGCPAQGTILDPFSGAGTTALVAVANGRNAIGIELNPKYVKLSRERLAAALPMFGIETALNDR